MRIKPSKGRAFVRFSSMSPRAGNANCIKVDNGPEFISRALDAWTRPEDPVGVLKAGKPTDNAHIDLSTEASGSVPEHKLVHVPG
jgi:hypothetical protein